LPHRAVAGKEESWEPQQHQWQALIGSQMCSRQPCTGYRQPPRSGRCLPKVRSLSRRARAAYLRIPWFLRRHHHQGRHLARGSRRSVPRLRVQPKSGFTPKALATLPAASQPIQTLKSTTVNSFACLLRLCRLFDALLFDDSCLSLTSRHTCMMRICVASHPRCT
jgi:hypothetical protein